MGNAHNKEILMTVKELIDHLQQFEDKEMEVCVYEDTRYGEYHVPINKKSIRVANYISASDCKKTDRKIVEIS